MYVSNQTKKKRAQCDRLSPCEACVARGIVDECKYSSTDEDREAIAQAETISTLRARVRRLRSELAETEAEGYEITELREGRVVNSNSSLSVNQGQGQGRKAENQAMEILYSAIRLGSVDLVARIVSGVREGRELVDVVRIVQV